MEFLVGMGFEREQCVLALDLSEGDQTAAMELLLSGVLETEDVQSALPPAAAGLSPVSPILQAVAGEVAQCAFSQYTFPGGKSACTLISALAAIEFIQLLSNPSANVLQLGDLAFRYQRLVEQGVGLVTSSGSTEHMSCEEALFFLPEDVRSPSLVPQCGSTMQGLLSNAQCFQTILDDSRRMVESTSARSQYTAILITKPPESVCILVPTRPAGASCWYLFDSHARPQAGLPNAHVMRFDSDSHVVAHLRQLFPALASEFPGDDDDMQLAMYNSVDYTAFALQSGVGAPAGAAVAGGAAVGVFGFSPPAAP